MKNLMGKNGIAGRFYTIIIVLIAVLPANGFAFEFVLVNASTDKDIRQLNNNDVIDLSQDGSNLNIRADLDTTEQVALVRFSLDGAVFRKEQTAPYALAGDNPGGDYLSWSPSAGSHSLTAVALDSNGDQLSKDSIDFNVSGTTSNGKISFTLVNAASDKDISQLGDGASINLNQVGSDLNIRADIQTSQTIALVRFKLDGAVIREEKTAPYALAGDNPGGDYLSWSPSAGSHSLTAVALDSSGNQLSKSGISFNVSSAATTTTEKISFALINANSDKDIAQLSDGDSIDLGQVGSNLNIRADIQTSQKIAKVRFKLDGTVYREEQAAPYALAGDTPAGDYLGWSPSVGSHSLTAIALDASSNQLGQETISFKVTTSTNKASQESDQDTDTAAEKDGIPDTDTSTETDDTADDATEDETDDGTDTTASDEFDSSKDLLSLHFDHCADPDDAHATVADRVIVGMEGLAMSKVHVVSGTCGTQIDSNPYQSESESVMDAAWGTSGWLFAGIHRSVDASTWETAVKKTAQVWQNIIEADGDIWIAEGGQSDFSADVIRKLRETYDSSLTGARIHLVQHSDWNELRTTSTSQDSDGDGESDGDLEYVQSNTDYIRIADGNDSGNGTADLHITAADSADAVDSFVDLAASFVKYSSMWDSAFDYLDPVAEKLDF